MIPGAVRGDGISCQTSNWCVKHGDTGLVVICRYALTTHLASHCSESAVSCFVLYTFNPSSHILNKQLVNGGHQMAEAGSPIHVLLKFGSNNTVLYTHFVL